MEDHQMKLNFNSTIVIFISFFLSFLSGNAQTTCIDPDLPVLNTSATVVCPGTNVNLAIASGALNDATDWYWYSNSCGGSPVGTGLSLSVNPTTTTTYYVRGEGGCVTPGACTGQTIVVLPPVTLSLKVFIQGYYLGNGQMTPSIYYSLGSPYQPTDVDLITVELRDVATCIVVGSYEVVLQTDGTVQVPVDCAVSGGTYYIVVKHRSSIETWSSSPVIFNGSVSYDFSAQQSNAYCDNEIDVMTEGIWSMYSGDFNQDGLINECDRTLLENDIANAVFGYFSTDLNGDGFVDALDLLLFDEILQLNIAMCSPCENAQALVVCPIIGPKTICGDGSGGTAVYSIAPVAGATQYNWTVPNGMTILGGQGSSSITVSWTGVAAQMGIVGVICVSVPTPCGVAECCDSIKIGMAPEVNLGPDIVLCNPGDCVVLASTPISNVNNYSWYTLPGFVSIPQTNASLLVCPTAPTCYALIVENMAGCKDTDTVCVSFYNPPLVSWSGLLAEQCGGDAPYTLSGGLPAGGVYSGDGVSGNQFNPGLAGVGSHLLSYTYSDSCGHVTTISKTINVINCPCIETFCRDFDDNDLHGWTVNPAAPMVDVQITSLNSQNGPADYYLLASDLTGLSLLKAETGFNGRWCCGEFCFDYRTFDDGDPNSVLDIHPVFYLVRGDKTFRFTSSVSVTETNGWQHVCAPITNCNPPPVSSEGVWEALPGTSNTDWDPLTNHIDSIFFQIDWNGGDEIAGFDNVCFNARNLSATIAAVDCNTLCATVNGCCGPFSYIWTVPPGVVITSGAGNSCIQGNLISGDYTVIVSNTTGEVSTTTYHLDFPPTASWSQTTVELCTSDSPYALSGAQPQSGAGGSGVYSGGTFITGTAPNQYFDPSLVSPGTYSVSYTFTDTCGNTSTVSVDFVVTDCACDIFGSDYSSASGWTQIGTSINIDATVIDKVSFLNVPGGSDHRVYRNIGLLGNTWTAEFDFNPMSGSNVGVASELLCLTAGNLIPFRETPLGNFTDQDFISAGVTSPFNTPNYLVSTQITASYKDDATTPVIAGSIDIPSWNTDFFVRLERFDATSGLLSVFSDAARTIHIPGSPVCLLFPSTVQGLNTLQHTNVNQAGAGRRFTGTVDNTCIRSTRTTADLTASVLSIDDYDCHHAGCIHLDIPPTAVFTISYYYEDPLNSNNNYASPVSNTTSILCNVPAGNYTIYLTDACGTNITLTATIQNLNPLAVSAGPDLTICQGACVNLSASPIVPGVTYAWYRLPDRSLLSSSPFLSDCPPVDFCYLLIATGSTGCMDSDSVCVNVELMQLTCSGTNVTCHGGTDGSVCATASCLNPPYSISWTKNGTLIQGAQTLCLNGLTAGTYCITITPSSGAIETCCYSVTEPAPLSIDAIAFDAPTCGGLGSFTFLPSGGSPPYTISTDPCPPIQFPCSYTRRVGFSTTENYPAGVYTITFTDSLGCTSSVVRTISQPAPPEITVDIINPPCCGDSGKFVVHINGGTGPYTVRLLTNTQPYSVILQSYFGINGPVFYSPNIALAGTYIVDVIDANFCFDSQLITIVDPPCLELHVSTTGFNGIDCDGHISAYATGGTPFNTNAPVFHVPYDIIITQISGNSPGITFSQSGTLNSNPFYNFADQCCNGVYVITATDSNGCTVTDTLRMNCNFSLNPAAGVQTTLCIRNTEDSQVGQLSPNSNYGASILLRASRWTYQGIWATVRTYLKFNINAVPQNSFSNAALSLSSCPNCTPNDEHKDLSPGNPWFANPPWGNASIISGVSGAWSENSITWNNAPAPNAITDAGASLGDQTTTSLNVNVTNIVQDWISSGVNNGLMIRLADDPAFPINYYHEVNFASRENADTNIHPRLCITYNASSVTVCAGTSVPLTAPLIPGVDYKWYTVPGFALAGSGNVLSVIATVSQQYAVIAITPSGCRDTNYVQVNVEPIDLVCSGSNVTCNGGTDGTACATFNCMNQPYTISWTKDGNLISGAQTLCLNGLSAGVYCINITPANGAVQTCCYTVTEPAPLSIDAIVFDAPTCGGFGSFSFIPLGGTEPYTISTDPCPPLPGLCSFYTPFGFSTTQIYPAGTYTIWITDDHGCTSSVVKTIGQPNPPAISVNVVQPLCCGDNGSFIAQFTGNGPYTILVRDNSSGSVLHTYFGISGSSFNCPDLFPAGSYTVEITDVNNCVSSAIINIIDPPCLNANVIVYDAPNCGGNGSFSIYPSGGTAPYTVSISPCPGGFLNCHFVTSNSFSTAQDYPAGTYTITFTDANGCTVTLVKTIHEPLPAQISVTTVNPLCCGGFGHFNVVITSGTGPYQILLTTNDVVNPTTLHAYLGYTGNNFTSPDEVPAGSYIVEVLDANGCRSSALIEIIDPPCLNVDAIAFDAPTCGGLGSFSFIVNGGTPPYTITTSPCPIPTYPCSFSTAFGFSTLQKYPAGVYTITFTDANGCTSTVVRTISQPAPPEITVDVINPLCCGDSGKFVVHINGGTGPYTVRLLTNTQPYSVILQSYFGINGPVFYSPNVALAGTYIVDVIDANGCFDSQLITIVDPPCLELHVNTSGFNGIDCDGHISAYATGGTPFNTNSPNFHVPYNILITQIAGNSPGITFSQSGLLNSNPFYNFADQCCNGVYVITATDSNGCTVTDTLRMNCDFKLSPIAGVPSTLCIRNTEDAQVGELSPNANYGSATTQRVSRWTYQGIWKSVRSYIKFNVNAVPQNSFTGATLSLSTCPTCTPYDVHKDLSAGNPWFANPPLGNASIISGVSGPWAENTITWNNAPAPTAITDAVASLGDQTTTGLNANVSNIVQDWMSSGVNNGLMIRLADDPAFPTNYYHEINFAAREVGDTNLHPRLCISYNSPSVTICAGSSVPLAAPLIAGVDYKWYTVPGYALLGSGNVISVSPLTNQLYAVIAITPSGCRDTNFVQVNVVTNVDDGDDCTSDYCLDGIVYHTRIISCTCPCTAPSTLSPNIVVNGNFSNGNTGFTSDLPYINACATNSYSVGNTARAKCASFLLIPDHTTGSGTGNDNFLIVDGRDAGTYTVWNGAVGNIVNGKTYTFSFALYPNVSSSTTLPNSIDVTLGNTVILSIPRSNLVNNSWNEFCTSFTATANIQAARLKISHTISGGGLGYDYGIDDIIFRTCRDRINLQNVSISNVSCYGGNNGSLTVIPSGGTSPYTYLWSNSATTATISNLSPGAYSVTVTDAIGDVSTTSLDVLEADPVIPTLSVTNPIQCYSGTTCIQVVGSGGTPPYSGTGTFCGYQEGTWTFTIVDSHGCFADNSITIYQPTKLENTVSEVSASCGLANGSATAAPNGGTPPYSYQWNTVPVQTGASAINLLPGIYTVTVTDANGCSRTDQITIGNSGGVPASPGAISGPAGVCRNQVNQVFCVPPVPGATSYLWTLPGGLTGTSTSNCITLSTSNTYAGGFICVRAINSCGISLATCMNLPVLTVKPPVPSSIIGNTTICGPGTYTFSTSVVANATVYNWSVTGSGVSIASGQGTNSITVSVPAGFGQGTVSVNAGNCVGNSGSRGIYITGVPSNSLPINGPTVVCAGTNNVSYTFGTVTGATSYVWTSNTPNMTVISQSGISCVVNFGPGFTTGNLSVNAISSCGSYTRTVIIKSVPSQPGGITGPYVNLCGAQTVSYSIAAVASATSYVWTSPAGTTILSGQGTTGISVSIPAAFAGGIVCVQAVNACGASIARCLTISALPPPPTGITGPITVCKSSTQNYSIAPIAGASSYSWSITGGAGLVSAGTSATVNFATAVSGTAILKVKGNNACGSSSPAQLSIVVNLGCKSSQTSELQNAGFAVYPNPSNGAFTLSFNAEKSSEYTLKVFDILGKAVFNDKIHAVNGENTFDIDLGNSAQGMYQLSIQNEEGETRTLRLVIE
ncbi:MAG: DNRLRE domain-containing protein [Bacteroidetes bacterium]|nr:DNRLRE domain-containing protein [Bacteroidota bacterium]